MKNLTIQVIPIHKISGKEKISPEKDRNRWSAAMYISGTLAIIFSVSGLIICGIYHLNLFLHSKIANMTGTYLMVLAIPLYFLAAHYLDKLDGLKK